MKTKDIMKSWQPLRHFCVNSSGQYFSLNTEGICYSPDQSVWSHSIDLFIVHFAMLRIRQSFMYMYIVRVAQSTNVYKEFVWNVGDFDVK